MSKTLTLQVERDMGNLISVPPIDTAVDDNSTSNHSQNRNSVVTQVLIAGDSFIFGLVIIAFVLCAMLWYIHKTNFNIYTEG